MKHELKNLQFDYDEFKNLTRATFNTFVTLVEFRERNNVFEKKVQDENGKVWDAMTECQNRLDSCEHYEDQNDRRVKQVDEGLKALSTKLDSTITYIN